MKSAQITVKTVYLAENLASCLVTLPTTIDLSLSVTKGYGGPFQPMSSQFLMLLFTVNYVLSSCRWMSPSSASVRHLFPVAAPPSGRRCRCRSAIACVIVGEFIVHSMSHNPTVIRWWMGASGQGSPVSISTALRLAHKIRDVILGRAINPPADCRSTTLYRSDHSIISQHNSRQKENFWYGTRSGEEDQGTSLLRRREEEGQEGCSLLSETRTRGSSVGDPVFWRSTYSELFKNTIERSRKNREADLTLKKPLEREASWIFKQILLLYVDKSHISLSVNYATW